MKEIWKKLKKVNKRVMKFGLMSMALGFLLAIGLRFALVSENAVHYHANFALYVDGVRDEFKNFTFYEEVQACGGDSAFEPKVRVHLHNNDPNVVHVHDDGVTWGHLLNNLGYGLTSNMLQTDSGSFHDGADGKKLSFILNGTAVGSVYNMPIHNEDRLLIDYSSDSNETLQQRFSSVVSTAKEHNGKADAGACSGSRPEGIMHRLKRTIGLSH